MKVTTDACLFGAWVADKFDQTIGPDNVKIRNVLEIGAGTGLLPLMLAQKNEAKIDTIEIDVPACGQAKENVRTANRQQSINVICGDARQLPGNKRYDLIISNPPFFQNQLRSDNNQINMARHDKSLTLEELINIVSDNLSPTGEFAVLLSYHRSDYFINLANAANLHLLSRVDVKQSPIHSFFRSMLHFGNQPVVNPELKELIIKEEEKYTADFIELLKDYYLYL